MGSFTDNIQALTNFTDYTPQLPIEAMVNVGTQKQAQYNQGVQKIQSYVDSVAGIDVIKPIHKEYLQSKLNELGSNLKKVAAGDFSNFQLVNNVGGMITQVSKDPVIQNAAGSTQRIRKQQQEVEEARQTGKGSVQNEAYWNNQLNNWLNDGNTQSSYNGIYTPYTDLDAKLRELVKDIPELESTQDIPLMRDNGGNVMYFDEGGNRTTPDKGRPRTDAAMLRMSTKGKSAQKILDNFLTSMDENDIQQLGIDGWYHYRSATKETFRNDIINTAESTKRRISDRVTDLSVEMVSNPNLTNPEKEAMQAEINRYNQSLKSGEVENKMMEDLREIDNITDLNAFKQKIYTEKFLGNLANATSYQSVKNTYETNPYWQADMQMKNLNLQYAKMRQDDQQFSLNYNLKIREQLFNESKEASKLLGAGGPNGPATENVPINSAVPGVSVETATQEIDSIAEQMKVFRNQHGEKIIPGYRDMSEQQREKAFNELAKNYNISPSGNLDNNSRAALEQYRALETDYSTKSGNLNSILEKSKPYRDQIDAVVGRPEFILEHEGEQYSPDEYLELYKSTEGGKYRDETGRKFNAEALLKDYEGTALEPLAQIIAKRKKARPLTKSESDTYIKMTQLSGRISGDTESLIKQKNQFESIELAKTYPHLISKEGSLDMTNESTAARVNNLINNINSRVAGGLTLDLNDGQSYNPETMFAWRAKPAEAKNLGYTLRKNGDGTGSLVVTRGTEVQTIPLSNNQFQNYFPEYAGSNPATPIISRVAVSPAKTTNTANMLGTPGSAVTAGYTANQLPTLIKDTPLASKVRFDIEGAYWNDGGDNDRFQIRMYVYDDNTKDWKNDVVNSEGFISADAIYPTLGQIGTKKVNEVLAKKK